MLRIALFNYAEAWIFAFLPMLLADRRRLSPLAVVPMWLCALGLTNAFVAPYMATRALLGAAGSQRANAAGSGDGADGEALLPAAARFGGWAVGGVALAVTTFAIGNALVNGGGEVEGFLQLCVADRTYLAFLVDLSLFSLFQAALMQDVPCERMDSPGVRFVPFVGIIAWLFA